jgi:hypothetical protein
LVLADWLEEHGDLDRAEFIRVQCQLARLASDDPRRPAVRMRERQLLAAHARFWVDGIHRFTRFSTFDRGLLYLDVSCVAAFLHQRAQAGRRLHAYPWVTGLRISHGQEARAYVRLRKQADAFSGLTHLQLGFGGSTPEEFAPFIAMPELGLLTHLDLSGSLLGDECITALARSPHLGRLTALGLATNQVSDAGVRELANSPYLGRLTTLSLSSNPISDQGAELLATAPGLRALTSVELFTFDVGMTRAGKEILQTRFGDGFRYVALSLPLRRRLD